MEQSRGVVLFGDVVGSRTGPIASTGWLSGLRRSLDATYQHQRLAPFEFTQGDEIQGLLQPDADPLLAILHSMLQPHTGELAVPRMRWVVVLGSIDPGRGPATHRTGEAFLRARALLDQARADRTACSARRVTGMPMHIWRARPPSLPPSSNV